MQTVIGRLTADAKVNQTKDGRKVINFAIAQNRRFRKKGSEEWQELTTYYNASYWIGTAIAEYLKKGTLIQAAGYIGMNVWVNQEGKAQGNVTLHVNFLEMLAKPKGNSATRVYAEAAPGEDLPF